MPAPLLLFRVGYMPSYDGAGPITGGGAHVKKYGEGGEMWNFRVEGGRCYGYVMTRHFAGIDLKRIDSTNQWKPNDELDGVDIVFFAKKSHSGQVVVGWYKGATVFHKSYRKRPENKMLGNWNKLDYLCQVDAEQAVLLPEEMRTFEVPYAPAKGKGFPGQSNVWYPHTDTSEVAKFVTRLRKYIGSSENVSRKNNRRVTHPDKDLIKRVEQAAISATRTYFTKDGYTVISVEKDNCGWDLEAIKDDVRLLVEVKGHIGNVIQFELTPNEYVQLRTNAKKYRVCVVRNALEDSEVEIYSPAPKRGTWVLNRCNGKGVIALSEKVAARAYETE